MKNLRTTNDGDAGGDGMKLFKQIDPVGRAYKRLKGYCAKHFSCSGCRFDGEDGCILKTVIPVDWPIEKDEKEAHP